MRRADTLKTTDYVIATIMCTELIKADGEKQYFGAWLVADITTDVIEQYRQARLPSGITGTNRHLELLRAATDCNGFRNRAPNGAQTATMRESGAQETTIILQ